MGEPRVKVSHLRQKHVSIGYALVCLCKTQIEILFEFFNDENDFLILKKHLFIPEQCCEANNVPQKCLGLCVEEEDAAVVARSAFTSICDKFRSIIARCTVEGGGI